MVADIEALGEGKIIFASNTSSLPIHKIAEKAQYPEKIIGLHYFSPVEKMPLVEVIPHEKTDAKTIATTVAFAKKQGKVAIVVAQIENVLLDALGGMASTASAGPSCWASAVS